MESWRAGWRQAFKLPAGQAIRDAARLAERMASTASDLRSQIAEALDAEAGEGPFSTLLGEVRTQLVSDIDSARFADMCAQTLTYGVLSSVVDPATGTGTFLVEWLRRARRSYAEAGEADERRAGATEGAGLRRPGDAGAPQNGDWPQHLREHVLPSMHAFENMLAPYAIAHLKVALELHNVGAGDAPAQILLTDTLDHRSVEQKLTTMQDPVAAEGERAADCKESERFTVVIGNPPYDREQRDVGDTGRRKGGVVRYGAPGVAPRGLGRSPGVSTTRARRRGAPPPSLLDDVTEPMRAAGLGIHIKNLYNDYVYFWRWAVWQATELPPGPGAVASITASSYLDGISMGGLRALLRDAFDELWIVDLGGEGRGALVEENVFDIRTPVAVAIGVR
ncbi:MAG: hypothetical protein OXG47_00520, partial [bacterium]|nr:hypothetical protein [bacterium]